MATPFLQLTLPVVSVTPGPDWAQSLNLAIITLDGHDHTSGFGARVPSAGINIDRDLAFNGHNATSFRTVRLLIQSAILSDVTDAGCLYVVGDDLFYNNGLGAAIQITSGGALSSIPTGNIQGDIGVGGSQLVYSSATKAFSFFQAINNFAKLSVGDLLIHEAGVVSPSAITVKSPAGLAAPFAVTLPASLPATNLPVQLSPTGSLAASPITNSMQNFGTPIANSDVATKGFVLGLGITQPTFSISPSSGIFSTSSTTFVDVTGLAVSIDSAGRPMILSVQPEEGTGNAADFVEIGLGQTALLALVRDGTPLAIWSHTNNDVASSRIPANFTFLDSPGAGIFNYKIQLRTSAGGIVQLFNSKLAATRV